MQENHNGMLFPWHRMTVDQFAGFERILGGRIIPVQGTYWRQVRPLFYRPLLPYCDFKPGTIRPPLEAFLGGFQYAVPPSEKANSFLNLLMFERAQDYSLDMLDYQRRRQVKLAAKQFSIRPIEDKQEFKEGAFPVYCSFYERTRYKYASERTKRDYFCRWVDALFQIPQLVALGAYRNGRLGGVSLSLLLGETLYYAIFFCDADSLRLQLSSLMLHFIRQKTAECKCAQQIFAGHYKNAAGTGVDAFYLQRGCKLVKKSAVLQLNPLSRFILKRLLQSQYAQLQGIIINGARTEAIGSAAPTSIPGVESGPKTMTTEVRRGRCVTMTEPASCVLHSETVEVIPYAPNYRIKPDAGF